MTGRAERQLEPAVTVVAGRGARSPSALIAAKTFSQPHFVSERPNELLGRTQPSTPYLAIALAVVAVGAYVTVHRHIVAARTGAARGRPR